jgi:sorbitol/mannitol transport system permease protein
MARNVTTRRKIIFTAIAWSLAFVIFFPILYTLITSVKTESEAIQGFDLIPTFTLENYVTVQTQRDYIKPFMNSVILSVGSTILALFVGIPAAWAMAFRPPRRPRTS